MTQVQAEMLATKCAERWLELAMGQKACGKLRVRDIKSLSQTVYETTLQSIKNENLISTTQ